ncbi:hypothetical protein [Nonomuraea lactucae]|uniref:hypothetical protein n=1 Tax=Nonomuraea lactucae TaxID=2249762 RepID=UPI000DE329C2|nr:hypothetical protein [Nonomuraea lactucae]
MLKKILPLLALAALLLGGAGIAAASVAAKEPAKSYGLCISKTGAVRVLEAKNLPKSRHGKCRAGERKVLVPSIDGVPKPFQMPAKMQFSYDGTTVLCTRGTDATGGVPAYACAKPTPSASPSPAS